MTYKKHVYNEFLSEAPTTQINHKHNYDTLNIPPKTYPNHHTWLLAHFLPIGNAYNTYRKDYFFIWSNPPP